MTSESASQPIETWNGSCQCGKVKYTVKMDKSLYDQEAISCNCSICQRNGYLFIYPKSADVTWHAGRDRLKSYTFAAKKIGHRFCPDCGTSVCAYSDDPGFFAGFTALNVRTFEDVDIERLKVKKADGRSLKDIEGIVY